VTRGRKDVIDGVDELVALLGLFQERLLREVELVVRPDGSCTLMQAMDREPAGESASGFEELARFDSIQQLLRYLA